MALQASGAINLSDLREEFGGTAPDALSEYYRGAGLVPDVVENQNVPTTGAISLSDFYSASHHYIHIDDHTLDAASTDGNSATVAIAYVPSDTYANPLFATWRFTVEGRTTGNSTTSGGSGTDGSSASGFGFYGNDDEPGEEYVASDSQPIAWINAGDYEIRATVQSGDTPTGSSVGTWLALSTTRSWGLSAFTPPSGPGDSTSCTLLIEIRKISTGVVHDSATINLSASSG